MAEFADGDYDADSGSCNSFSIMYQFRGLQAFIVSESTAGGAGGSGGSGGGGSVLQPYDQCVNDADQAALEALATEDQSGIAIVGGLTGGCTQIDCAEQLGAAITGGEDGRNALRDCIANCISDQTGVSVACTSCYGSIAACSVGFCIAPCAPPNDGSQECIDCALDNCIDVAACTGL
jgi:hypothetical protein